MACINPLQIIDEDDEVGFPKISHFPLLYSVIHFLSLKPFSLSSRNLTGKQLFTRLMSLARTLINPRLLHFQLIILTRNWVLLGNLHSINSWGLRVWEQRIRVEEIEIRIRKGGMKVLAVLRLIPRRRKHGYTQVLYAIQLLFCYVEKGILLAFRLQ